MSQIEIRVTIDTTSLPQAQEDPGDAANPLSIPQDSGFMVMTASAEVEMEGAGKIAFAANAGDTLHFFLSSGANNFEQPILLTDIRYTGGDEILRDCANRIEERTAILPGTLPPALATELPIRQFQFFQCVVDGEGTGSYDLVFALYEPAEGEPPRLVGQYRWAMRLTPYSNRRKS
jgi:hypothetical protein